jgi:hypothetical protein
MPGLVYRTNERLWTGAVGQATQILDRASAEVSPDGAYAHTRRRMRMRPIRTEGLQRVPDPFRLFTNERNVEHIPLPGSAI